MSPQGLPRRTPALSSPAPCGIAKERAGVVSPRARKAGAMDDDAKAQSIPGPNLTRNVVLHLRLTASERAILISAAEVLSMPTSSWIRYHALRVAAGVSRPPGPFQAPATRHPSDRLSHAITARFTRAEHEGIVEHVRACGLTLSSLIRKQVLGYAPMVRQPSARSAIAAELGGEIRAPRAALLRADAAGAADPGD